MKPSKFKYLKPSSVNEALTYLEEYGDDCKIISGGQSLIPVLNMRLSTPDFLIDVSGIKELNYIREEDGYIAIGALTRHVEVENSLLIKEKCPLLIDAIKWVGHKQIRNRGTIGGSVAHGDPSAELPCVLTTLRGEIVIASVDEEEVVGPEDFFLTYLLTSLQTNQLVKEIRFPIMTQGERVGHSFVEVARRHGDFGLAIAAAVIELDNQGLIQKAQLAVGGVNPVPLIIEEAEELLIGKEVTEALLKEIAELTSECVDPEGDLHGSADYRRELIGTLLKRAIEEAIARAWEGEEKVG
ncbi:xanthine dehydrogenase family protein subunit M [Cytobacillus sp. FSL W7-1323]|uniref:Molybdopterin dehydrogenase n=1 Tax=Cytobacillus kochii TaxID=859143 RepID=A0A248TMT3_9BACI|nr:MULTISPECIES: xanthine dehydrogenase family protein subunit M [Cytobacillus]ASV69523.1 molybdopterin dehydrogenase [Cytobacillus kochii]MEA1852522.1 xanthine dehydrogenase family protein subunit M [Cytobacillus sp. OWB-43]MED1604604.1 xanthine dehydrogenase family protein subunit M [Cytobacillus kochii]